VQKYGKKKCRQIFTGLFFHEKLVVINKFASRCEGKTVRCKKVVALRRGVMQRYGNAQSGMGSGFWRTQMGWGDNFFS
jgi:hypothetical protein